MHTYPTLNYLLDLPFDELLSISRLDRHSAAEHFGRTVRTIDNWRKNPPESIRRQLLGLAGYLEVHGNEWRGWRVWEDTLITDSGIAVKPSEIRALPWLHAIAAERSRYWREKIKATTQTDNLIGLPVAVRNRL